MHPLFPFLFHHTHAQSVLTPHKRNLQQHRFLGQLLDPTVFRQLGGLEAEVGKAARLAIDQRVATVLLPKATKLTVRRRSHLQVDEMHLDLALGEETLGFSGIGAFLDAEDLNLHGWCEK